MGIKFPRMHVAESSVNRIFNMLDDLQAGDALGALQNMEPSAEDKFAAAEAKARAGSDPGLPGNSGPQPDTTAGTFEQGAAIDSAVAQPPPSMNVPASTAGAVAVDMNAGANLIDTATML